MFLQILICIGAIEALGYLSVYLTDRDIGSEYRLIQDKNPNVAFPPQWLFSPVWIVLYAMLGYVLAVNLPKSKERAYISLLLLVGLGLNFIWTPLYFREERTYALYVILAMDLLNVAIIGYLLDLLFLKRNTKDIVALVFMLLYSGWVGFATYLNLATV
jgi:benzodiazapine receptor